MTATFSVEAAAWLTEVVVPRWLAKGGDRSVCPCQYGSCGWCSQQNRHDRCTSNHGSGPSPETYVVSRQGHVASGIGFYPQVWVVGRACVWVCACACAAAPATGQMDLLDLIGATV